MEDLFTQPTPLEAQAIYGLAWLSFGIVHSVLAGASAKRRLDSLFGVYYRLAYNLWAGLHIAAVWALGGALIGDQPYPLEPGVAGAMTAVRVLGVVVLVLALREYDLGRFSGVAQIRAQKAGNTLSEDEPLITSGLHLFVRHPLYLGAYLILWGGATGDFGLATAVWGSVYLAVGAAFEDRKLLALYGDEFRDYKDRIPAVIPWRGRVRGH
ncbi:MAG: isoprenylcysteine carboxylmethyltransferase family protein [Proteobacteria bacterium]|nr:isoprenylcysteine carboxylmethyltransferase family protein [Pseudomonadota bacterium]